jgi:hypothetical protein
MRLSIFLIIGILATSSTFAAEKANKSQKNSGVSGQVFVVTKGGQTFKLPIIEVNAIPEKVITQYIASRQQTRQEQIAILQPKVDTLKTESKNLEEIYMGSSMFKDPEHETKHQAWKSKVNEFINVRVELDEVLSDGYFFVAMPPSKATAKTDADGKFKLSLPAGKYALAAFGSRHIAGDIERYHWLVWVTVPSKGDIMLSNDNMMDTTCRECVVTQ